MAHAVTGGVAMGTAIAAVVLYRIIGFGLIIGAGWIMWSNIRRHHSTSPDALPG
ncbi:hypothetical protein [Streptomyces shaanxiensis]|uniref:Uncharacterized protein n=1 Tax=Streptomyces shaanxiensis TaxID=653357 RepID=A0ABP7UZB4_9ACTN